jgi:predicted dehydrogenase
MKQIKVGMAGIGAQGRIHLLNCLHKKETEVVAVADQSKSVLSKVNKLGIKTYSEYNVMIEKEKPDVVIIALPNFLHADCCLTAAENGCDILVEKPLAMNFKEGKEIAEKVEKTGVKLMVGMNHRFINDVEKIKADIESGTLGRIDFASALFFTGPFFGGRKVSEWIFDPKKVGGALLDAGCHMIDLLLWYFGEPKSIAGYSESQFNLGYDDYSEVSLRFKNGVNAVAVVSWRSRVPRYRIEVVGEYGRKVAFSQKFGIYDFGIRKGLINFGIRSIFQRIKGQPFSPLGDYIYYKELNYFVDSILQDKEPRPNAEDWLNVLKIVDQVYHQSSLT